MGNNMKNLKLKFIQGDSEITICPLLLDIRLFLIAYFRSPTTKSFYSMAIGFLGVQTRYLKRFLFHVSYSNFNDLSKSRYLVEIKFDILFLRFALTFDRK